MGDRRKRAWNRGERVGEVGLRQHGSEPGVLHANLDRDGASHVAETSREATENVAEEEAGCMRGHDRGQ